MAARQRHGRRAAAGAPLRKEFGSAINESFGIYAASRALRHANLPITESIYIDSRGSRPTTGLDRLLASAGDA